MKHRAHQLITVLTKYTLTETSLRRYVITSKFGVNFGPLKG